MNRKLSGALKIAVIFVVLPVLALALLWRDRCKETILAELTSPDESFVARLKSQDCGPSMKPASVVDLEAKTGEAAGKAKTVAILQGTEGVALQWTGPKEITVNRPKERLVVSKEQAWEGVIVRVPEP